MDYFNPRNFSAMGQTVAERLSDEMLKNRAASAIPFSRVDIFIYVLYKIELCQRPGTNGAAAGLSPAGTKGAADGLKLCSCAGGCA